jgi:uncharacterized coiled-coil DUF342 family protein
MGEIMKRFLLFFYLIIAIGCVKAYDISDSQGNTYYKNISVINVSPNGAVIMHSTGWAEVSFGSLPKEVIEKLKSESKRQFPDGVEITDAKGNEYEKVTVSCVEEDGITVEHSRGTTFILFKDLPEEWQKTSGIVNTLNPAPEQALNEKAEPIEKKAKPLNLDLSHEQLKKQLSDKKKACSKCKKEIAKLNKALNDYPGKIYIKLISDANLKQKIDNYRVEKIALDKTFSETKKKYREAKKLMTSHVSLDRKRSISERIGWRYETDPVHTVRSIDELETRDKSKAIRYIYPEDKGAISKTKSILSTSNEYTRIREEMKRLKKQKTSFKERFKKIRHLYKRNVKNDLENSREKLKKLNNEISKIKSKLSESS